MVQLARACCLILSLLPWAAPAAAAPPLESAEPTLPVLEFLPAVMAPAADAPWPDGGRMVAMLAVDVADDGTVLSVQATEDLPNEFARLAIDAALGARKGAQDAAG